MATNINVPYGGYDYNFVDGERSKDCICHICILVSRDPQKVSCCGNIYCISCLQQLKESGNYFKCPTCRSDISNNYFSDTRADKKIKSLEVYCTNRESYCLQDGSSCQWKGYLKDIDTHLQQCPYQFISCTNDCREYVQRKQLQYHLENDCPNRLIICQYCKEEDIYDYITEYHFKVCPQYPILCTNEGCDQEIPRVQMKLHKSSCLKEIICCRYKSIGCDQKMKREEQKEHSEQSMEEHLQMALEEILVLKEEIFELNYNIERTEQALLQGGRYNLSHQPMYHYIQFRGFRKVKNEVWYSPGFYTTSEGYKMCLNIVANSGHGKHKGSHVFCGICLMSGEYDNILEWPFQGEVTIELLNQLEDGNHHKLVVPFNESTPQEFKNKVVGKRYGEGYLQYISHSQLVYKSSLNCQYLKDNTLYFRVSVNVTSKTKPWLVGHIQ